MRRIAVAVVALAAIVGAAGCGVPADRNARALSAGGVPFGLLAPTTPTTIESPGIDDSSLVTVDIELLGPSGGRLVQAGRKVATPVQLVSVLEQLLSGPSVGELAAGYQTLISTQTRLLGAQVDPSTGVASVDVSREFLEVSGPEQIFALAQIVYTATNVPGVQSVRFLIEGDPKEVPTQDGTLTQRPLTRTDYARLAES